MSTYFDKRGRRRDTTSQAAAVVQQPITKIPREGNNHHRLQNDYGILTEDDKDAEAINKYEEQDWSPTTGVPSFSKSAVDDSLKYIDGSDTKSARNSHPTQIRKEISSQRLALAQDRLHQEAGRYLDHFQRQHSSNSSQRKSSLVPIKDKTKTGTNKLVLGADSRRQQHNLAAVGSGASGKNTVVSSISISSSIVSDDEGSSSSNCSTSSSSVPSSNGDDNHGHRWVPNESNSARRLIRHDYNTYRRPVADFDDRPVSDLLVCGAPDQTLSSQDYDDDDVTDDSDDDPGDTDSDKDDDEEDGTTVYNESLSKRHSNSGGFINAFINLFEPDGSTVSIPNKIKTRAETSQQNQANHKKNPNGTKSNQGRFRQSEDRCDNARRTHSAPSSSYSNRVSDSDISEEQSSNSGDNQHYDRNPNHNVDAEYKLLNRHTSQAHQLHLPSTLNGGSYDVVHQVEENLKKHRDSIATPKSEIPVCRIDRKEKIEQKQDEEILEGMETVYVEVKQELSSRNFSFESLDTAFISRLLHGKTDRPGGADKNFSDTSNVKQEQNAILLNTTTSKDDNGVGEERDEEVPLESYRQQLRRMGDHDGDGIAMNSCLPIRFPNLLVRWKKTKNQSKQDTVSPANGSVPQHHQGESNEDNQKSKQREVGMLAKTVNDAEVEIECRDDVNNDEDEYRRRSCMPTFTTKKKVVTFALDADDTQQKCSKDYREESRVKSNITKTSNARRIGSPKNDVVAVRQVAREDFELVPILRLEQASDVMIYGSARNKDYLDEDASNSCLEFFGRNGRGRVNTTTNINNATTSNNHGNTKSLSISVADSKNLIDLDDEPITRSCLPFRKNQTRQGNIQQGDDEIRESLDPPSSQQSINQKTEQRSICNTSLRIPQASTIQNPQGLEKKLSPKPFRRNGELTYKSDTVSIVSNGNGSQRVVVSQKHRSGCEIGGLDERNVKSPDRPLRRFDSDLVVPSLSGKNVKQKHYSYSHKNPSSGKGEERQEVSMQSRKTSKDVQQQIYTSPPRSQPPQYYLSPKNGGPRRQETPHHSPRRNKTTTGTPTTQDVSNRQNSHRSLEHFIEQHAESKKKRGAGNKSSYYRHEDNDSLYGGMYGTGISLASLEGR